MAERPHNIYFDYWAERYEFFNRMPYADTNADWVQLDRLLTKSGKLSERISIEVWKRGVDNYLASNIGVHALHKLCSGPVFVAFWRSPQDRYGKPREIASQVGAAAPVAFASWHPKFLAACWKLAQKDKSMLEATTGLLEQVVDMDEVTAFRRLRGIERGSETGE